MPGLWQAGSEAPGTSRSQLKEINVKETTPIETCQSSAGPLAEIAGERQRQDAKWGQQNHPLVDRFLIKRGPTRLAEEYEVPTEQRAKAMCDLAARRGEVTFAHILVEEVAEFVAVGGDPVRAREELMQVAAVAVAAIEAIDRQTADEGQTS